MRGGGTWRFVPCVASPAQGGEALCWVRVSAMESPFFPRAPHGGVGLGSLRITSRRLPETGLVRCRTSCRCGRTASGWRTLVRPACTVDTLVDFAQNYPPQLPSRENVGQCGRRGYTCAEGDGLP